MSIFKRKLLSKHHDTLLAIATAQNWTYILTILFVILILSLHSIIILQTT